MTQHEESAETYRLTVVGVTNALRLKHSAKVTMSDGRRLVLMPPMLVTCEDDGYELMIAFERGGVVFYDGTYPLTQFKLVSAGFDFHSAQLIAGLIADIMLELFGSQPRLTDTASPKREALIKPKPKKQKTK